MLRSISSNWSLNALQILVFMVLTPFAVDALGREDYGVWEVLVAAAGPLQLLALGLPMATVRAVSSAVAAQDPDEASRAAGTSLSLTLILGACAALIGLAVRATFAAYIASEPEWSGLGAARVADAKFALDVLLANVAAGFALALPYALYDAHQDFVARNLIRGAGLIVKLGATIGFLTLRADLTTLAFVQIGVAALEFAVALTVSRVRHPGVSLRPRAVRWTEARSLLSFSVFAFLLNMGALLAFRIDALVIGAHRPPAEAAVYGFGNKIFDPFIQVLLGIGMVLMPMAAAAARRNDLDAVREAFLRWSKIAVTIVALVGGYLMVLGPEFLAAWIGDEYSPRSGDLLRILMLSFFLFLPVRGVALPVLMGLGRAKAPGLGLLAMGFANLGLSVALIGPYGLVGVALGTAIPNVVFSIVFARTACVALDVGPLHWLGYAFVRPLAAALVASAVLWGAAEWLEPTSFPVLVGAGVCYTALFGVLALAIAFRGDARFNLSLPGPLRRLGA
ncbi:MAG: polysaccharide biosynthesis C-terminal domain-containing protein [Planctomycetota bacterium]